jgi:CheY-like chemotaxis protein
MNIIRSAGTDVVVVSADLADMPGPELLQRLSSEARSRKVPVIVFNGKPLTKRQESGFRRAADSMTVRAANTVDQFKEEVGRLIQPAVLASEAARGAPRKIEPELLAGKKVLVVDEDVRNIFALTSLLERYKIEVLFAENGRTAIAMLQNTPGVDIVLMDVMMPEMDGYDTMRAIRQLEQFQRLPIIALTARAMKGDREKCIEAGASDYIPKPVAPDQLLLQLCTWVRAIENQPVTA